MNILNWSLIQSPYNWATVAIMALFGLVLLAVLFPEPSNT
jgi:hypothetical protein